MRLVPVVFFALFGLTLTEGAYAEVLLLDAISQEPANAPQGLPRPRQGARMDQVRARYGEPKERATPVGDPPITRWVYPAYTVYFEQDLVLTSVVHR